MNTHGPNRLAAQAAVLAGVLALGATGATLAMMGLGLSLPIAAVASGAAAGLVQFGVVRYVLSRQQGAPQHQRPAANAAPDHTAAQALDQRLDVHRTQSAALRHDLRGMLSPVLMVSDRLLGHADPAVAKAGQVIVRSIERATGLLASHRDATAAAVSPAEQEAGQDRPATPQ
jgi:signal transduction histidine kinase